LDFRYVETKEALMKCPNCKDPNLVISERKGIEIDYCPDCRGIWLDRGELDKILEKARDEGEPERQQPEPRHPGYYGKPYKRRKSFLEELFD
jgi:Zn-finger nucleic acid-binding protein